MSPKPRRVRDYPSIGMFSASFQIVCHSAASSLPFFSWPFVPLRRVCSTSPPQAITCRRNLGFATPSPVQAVRTPPNPNLLFLAIDSDSVSLDETLDIEGLFSSSSSNPELRRALEIMSKGWPWNREIYAIILERLVGAGARVVAFDCLFPEPAPGDDAFRAGPGTIPTSSGYRK